MVGEDWKHGSTAGDMMETEPLTVGPDDSVFETVQLLLRRKVTGVPVVDEDHRLLGMLSEKECIRALIRAIHYRMPPSFVRDVMARNPVTVTEETSILTLSDLFVNHDFRRIPVIRGERLVGQVTRIDLLRAAVQVFRTAPSRQQAVLYLSALDDRSSGPPG